MSGSGTSKNYKIIVDSKHFGNMKGFSPAEVAKRAAGKILGLSNKINRFSLVETKNGKIRNYKVSKENLIRPYKKNGKMITFRIIVKKIGKHTGGVIGPLPKEIYEKKEFTEEDIKEIKARMFIENTYENDYDNYDPYNLELMINNLSTDENGHGLVLSSHDPIHHFFKEYSIEIDHDNLGWMKISVSTHRKKPYIVNYEFSGNEKNFLLVIYNLQEAWNKKEIKKNCTNYVNFLRKLYPESKIDIFYSGNSKGSNSNGSNSNGSNSNSSNSNSNSNN